MTGTEVGQASVDDVDGAEEVCLELVADVVVILVFAGADDAVAGAVGDDVHTAPVGKGLLHNVFNSGSDAYVAE